MSGQNVQRVRGRGKFVSLRSMQFSSSESGIFCLKYGIKEFSYRVICWNGLHDSRGFMISGVILIFSRNICNVSKYHCTQPKYFYVTNCNVLRCTNRMLQNCDRESINREGLRREWGYT